MSKHHSLLRHVDSNRIEQHDEEKTNKQKTFVFDFSSRDLISTPQLPERPASYRHVPMPSQGNLITIKSTDQYRFSLSLSHIVPMRSSNDPICT